ncbi:MAG: hypothetical protein HQ503_14095 [Rhodospirillales bacterium]|nr:hypothetical protein [Rhodospirillales bacterium]
MISARNVLLFKPMQTLRDRVNGSLN